MLSVLRTAVVGDSGRGRSVRAAPAVGEALHWCPWTCRPTSHWRARVPGGQQAGTSGHSTVGVTFSEYGFPPALQIFFSYFFQTSLKVPKFLRGPPSRSLGESTRNGRQVTVRRAPPPPPPRRSSPVRSRAS